jgi:hypothetical protein
MTRIAYDAWEPKGDAIDVVIEANRICADYRNQGYDLTLRQLYYQFVARSLIPNNQRSYKRLGDIVNKARLAGLLDWTYIVDRTRNLQSVGHWDDPSDIIDSAARSFRIDKWANQPVRVEVWVEKEALAGIIGQVSSRWDCSYFSCRGYVSQSELWGAAQRLGRYITAGQAVVVLHLGDHDPSGIDMTRDIEDRLRKFLIRDWLNAHADEFEGDRVTVAKILGSMTARCGGRSPLEVRRIALNSDQVEDYDPPPNPAKLTDSRANGYIEVHGYESWELDALDPNVLDSLVEDHILGERDDLWAELAGEESRHRDLLGAASARWDDVVELLDGAES